MMTISINQSVFENLLELAVDKSELLRMFKFLVALAMGIYSGVYVSQNYDVPRVETPSELVEKIVDIIDECRKK